MKIRIATLKDLDSILRIYEHARSFMASHGNPTQWGTTYPPVDMIEHDIRMGNAYVCEENNRVIAVFYYWNYYYYSISIPYLFWNTGINLE